jgi:hypothetical protein
MAAWAPISQNLGIWERSRSPIGKKSTNPVK